MQTIEYILGALFLVSSVSYFLSTFIYLPFYMTLLKLHESKMYDELGGISVFTTTALFHAPLFFCEKKYQESESKWVVFHGKILRWSQGYMLFTLVFTTILFVFFFLIVN